MGQPGTSSNKKSITVRQGWKDLAGSEILSLMLYVGSYNLIIKRYRRILGRKQKNDCCDGKSASVKNSKGSFMSGKISPSTLRAIELFKGGLTPYAAAKKAGIQSKTMYVNLKKLGYRYENGSWFLPQKC